MRAFCLYPRRRFEPTHGDVLNLHTGRREGGVLFSLSSLLSSFSLSLFRRSLHSFSFSFSSLSLLSSLSVTTTMITRPVGSLCVHTALTCQSVRVHGPWPISLLAEHVRIMQETTVLAYLCKPRATWNEVGLYLCWKWVMCNYVSVCVSMCLYVSVCVSMCCLRCVVGCVSVGVDALAVVRW